MACDEPMMVMLSVVESSLGIDLEKSRFGVLLVELELVLDKIQAMVELDDVRVKQMAFERLIVVVVENFAWKLVETEVMETFDTGMAKIRRMELDCEYHCEIDVQLVQPYWDGREYIVLMLLDY